MLPKNSTLRTIALTAALVVPVLLTTACQSVYYSAMEWAGSEKRDLLRAELTGMVGDQEDAEAAFTDALTRIKELTGFDGGSLEDAYDDLKDAHEDAHDAVDDIDSRMDEIETVARDLFAEWESEIDEYSSPAPKRESQNALRDTRRRYDELHASLTETRRSMDPILAELNDHVLSLKHRLNAAAIGSLGAEMASIEAEIERLKRRIQASIAQAQRFIEALPS